MSMLELLRGQMQSDPEATSIETKIERFRFYCLQQLHDAKAVLDRARREKNKRQQVLSETLVVGLRSWYRAPPIHIFVE